MSETFNKYLSVGIKLILVLSIITSINNHLWHIASTNIFLLALTFAPQILKSQIKIKFPKKFEILLLLFVIVTLFLGKISWIVAPIIFGIGTGLIALLILFILYSSNQIKRNSFLIIILPFTFAVTLGTIIEISKFALKLLLNQELGNIYIFTMLNLTYVLIGAAIATAIGFFYLRTGFKFVEKILKKIKKINPELFKKTNSLQEIIQEIKQGESETQEFKSTLRINLHTNQPDRNIENATLKTIISFLNTRGGTLYLGITDDGKISGIEKDKFENKDKFQLHLINLLKQRIGKKHLNLIKSETIKIKDRNIVRIECKKSKKPIFLKDGKEEHFYMRIGPQTSELKASELVEYIDKRFGKNN